MLVLAAEVLVLGGCTGVGKTAILHELRLVGQQILDLEGLAKHRGSAFGATGEAQPSNEAQQATKNNQKLKLKSRWCLFCCFERLLRTSWPLR